MTQAITLAHRAKRALAALAFTVSAAFVAAPSSPIAALAPGVGDAQAYAPCYYELVALQDAHAIYLMFPYEEWALDDFLDALDDYNHCMG